MKLGFQKVGNLGISAFNFLGGSIKCSKQHNLSRIQKYEGTLHGVEYPGFFGGFEIQGFRKLNLNGAVIMGVVASNFESLLDSYLADDEIDPFLDPYWLFKLDSTPLLSDVNQKDYRTSRISGFERGVYNGFFTDLVPEIYQEIVGNKERNLSSLVDCISKDDSLIRELEKELSEHSNPFRIRF